MESVRTTPARPESTRSRSVRDTPNAGPPRGLRARSTIAAVRAVTLALALGLGPAAATAQEHDHEEGGHAHPSDAESGGPGAREAGGHTHEGLHFSHPLLTESVSPDTKVRVDHQYVDFEGGFRENAGFLEGEYAFHRSFSIEVGLPYSYTEGALGNFSANLKFANYAFEGAGLLLGYGVELSAPTAGTPDFQLGEGDRHGHEDEDHAHEEAAANAGARVEEGRRDPARPPVPEPARTSAGHPGDGTGVPPARFHTGGAGGVHAMLGTDEWEVAPYVNLGLRTGDVELVGWAIFGIPFSQADQEEVATQLSYDLSALYHVSSRLQALLELNGSGGLSGSAVGEDVAALSPGLKFRPAAGQPVWIGLAGSLPLWGEDPFEARALASLLWHF